MVDFRQYVTCENADVETSAQMQLASIRDWYAEQNDTTKEHLAVLGFPLSFKAEAERLFAERAELWERLADDNPVKQSALP